MQGRLTIDERSGEPQVWIEVEPGDEQLDVAYGQVAGAWVEAGYVFHYVMVAADDRARLDEWFELGFGKQHCYAELELGPREPPAPDGFTVRFGSEDDAEGSIALGNSIRDAHFSPPVWSGVPPHAEEELRQDAVDSYANPDQTSFAAERDGELVGELVMAHRDEETVHLGYAAVRPDVRGLGVGVALTEAALAWASEQSYRRCTTNWRTTNPLASRFWPNRGFIPVTYRLHRLVRPSAAG